MECHGYTRDWNSQVWKLTLFLHRFLADRLDGRPLRHIAYVRILALPHFDVCVRSLENTCSWYHIKVVTKRSGTSCPLEGPACQSFDALLGKKTTPINTQMGVEHIGKLALRADKRPGLLDTTFHVWYQQQHDYKQCPSCILQIIVI